MTDSAGDDARLDRALAQVLGHAAAKVDLEVPQSHVQREQIVEHAVRGVKLEPMQRQRLEGQETRQVWTVSQASSPRDELLKVTAERSGNIISSSCRRSTASSWLICMVSRVADGVDVRGTWANM